MTQTGTMMTANPIIYGKLRIYLHTSLDPKWRHSWSVYDAIHSVDDEAIYLPEYISKAVGQFCSTDFPLADITLYDYLVKLFGAPNA